MLGLASALASCTTVGANFVRPAPPAVSGYAMAGDAAPPTVTLSPETRVMGAWWRGFGSTSLDTVMDQALADNQTIAQAIAVLDKAREQAASVRGGTAPQVSANASAAEERINLAAFGFSGFPGLPPISSPTIHLLSIGAMASYDFDLFGGERRQVEAATAVAETQRHKADVAYITLTGNVAMASVRIAAIRAQMDAVVAIIADDQRNLDMVEQAERAGGEAPAAATAPRAQLAADQALLPPLAQQLAQARHSLALLVGKPPAAWTAPDFDVAGFRVPKQIPVELPASLVRARPDILAAEAELHADTARIGVATANLYPDIKLQASFAQSALEPTSLFSYAASGWSIGPQLTAPIFNGGRLRADKRAAEAQARASLAQYRQTVLTAFTQVADVLTALAHDKDRIAALTAARDAAERSVDDARTAFGLGGGPAVNIVTQQRQLERARLDLVQAQSQQLLDIVELYAATATDWRETPS